MTGIRSPRRPGRLHPMAGFGPDGEALGDVKSGVARVDRAD